MYSFSTWLDVLLIYQIYKSLRGNWSSKICITSGTKNLYILGQLYHKLELNLIFFFKGTYGIFEKTNFQCFQSSKPEHTPFSMTNPILNNFWYIPYTLQSIYKSITLCYLFLSLFYIPPKAQKLMKFTTFPLKTRSHFSFLIHFFFLLNNTKKTLYANVPEMFSFNPNISNQKYPIFRSWY